MVKAKMQKSSIMCEIGQSELVECLGKTLSYAPHLVNLIFIWMDMEVYHAPK